MYSRLNCSFVFLLHLDLSELARRHSYTAGKVLITFLLGIAHKPVTPSICAIITDAIALRDDAGDKEVINELVSNYRTTL
jgi:hypothetical protein